MTELFLFSGIFWQIYTATIETITKRNAPHHTKQKQNKKKEEEKTTYITYISSATYILVPNVF
jgi:hypothetical protein